MKKAVTSYQEQIDSKLDEMIALSSTLAEDVVYWKPSAEAWSVQEVLSHVEEAIPYWIGEVVKVANRTSAEWGRTMQDATRLAAIARANDIPTADFLQKLEQTKATIRQSLLPLKEEELKIEAPSRNPKFGTKPLTFIMDHFVIEHIETHIKQIQRNVSQYK